MVWILHPALVYASKRVSNKAVHRMLLFAANHKSLHSHLDILSASDMSLAIEASAKNEAAVKFWLELIAIVSDGQVGGSHAGLVAEWDSRSVRDMLYDVAPPEDDQFDVVGDDAGVVVAGAAIDSRQKKSVSVANQIARIMMEVSLHGTGSGISGNDGGTVNFMSRLSSLFHSHVLACSTCDPFDDISLDTASAAQLNTSSDDSFVSRQLQELRGAVSSCALSDALIFVQSFAGSGTTNSSTAAPTLQSLMAAHHTSAQFITRISKFFIAAVEIGLLLISSGTVSAAAAATVLWKLCPTLASRYLNHMLLLIPSTDTSNATEESGHKSRIHQRCNPSSLLFAPLDHALPLLHQCACSHKFHSWASLSGSHSASALRAHNAQNELSGTSLGICSDSDASGALNDISDTANGIAHHCSSFSAPALLRVLNLEWGLDVAIRPDMVGEHIYVQQHELVSRLQDWMCKSAVSGGGDQSIISSGSSSVSVWRCDAFRTLNCCFMELACSSSLMLASLGIVASRLLTFDVVFQDVSAVAWQQATLHVAPALAGSLTSDEQKQAKRPCYSNRQQHDRNSVLYDNEDISLTDDEDDDTHDLDIPNGCDDLDSTDISSQGRGAPAFHPNLVNALPGFSEDACWHKLHAAMLLLPTAVSRQKLSCL